MKPDSPGIDFHIKIRSVEPGVERDYHIGFHGSEGTAEEIRRGNAGAISPANKYTKTRSE